LLSLIGKNVVKDSIYVNRAQDFPVPQPKSKIWRGLRGILVSAINFHSR
jgi:hypothetical protein